eukprot:TRINITY_DN12696_c0_g4_i2.p1 TRINITY_DN12696_c0_g4~~TRINITY_DN12696_c0_g4_i2.p1  ORF type:complete len:486 (-),score=24.52 TRINITY_DN12696_c0_g4_i2:171-1628(-)
MVSPILRIIAFFTFASCSNGGKPNFFAVLVPNEDPIKKDLPYYIEWSDERTYEWKTDWELASQYGMMGIQKLPLVFTGNAKDCLWERGGLKLRIEKPSATSPGEGCTLTVSTKLTDDYDVDKGTRNYIMVESLAGFHKDVAVRIGGKQVLWVTSVGAASEGSSPQPPRYERGPGYLNFGGGVKSSWPKGTVVERVECDEKSHCVPYEVKYKQSFKNKNAIKIDQAIIESQMRSYWHFEIADPDPRFEVTSGTYRHFNPRKPIPSKGAPEYIDIFWPSSEFSPKVTMYATERIPGAYLHKPEEIGSGPGTWPHCLVNIGGVQVKRDDVHIHYTPAVDVRKYAIEETELIKNADDHLKEFYTSLSRSKGRSTAALVQKKAPGAKLQTFAHLARRAPGEEGASSATDESRASDDAVSSWPKGRRGSLLQTLAHLARRAPGEEGTSSAIDESRASDDAVSSWPKAFADRALQRRAEKRRLAKRKAFLAG